QDVITVGSTMRIPFIYRGEYFHWHERFMNYLEEHTYGEAMINSIQNGDQPLPVIAQVSLAGNAQNLPPTLKDPKFWTAEEKKTRKIDRLARSLLIQGLSNDIYSLTDSNETAKDLWDALERQMRSSEYGKQDRKSAILYEYETFKANEGEQLSDTYLRYLQLIHNSILNGPYVRKIIHEPGDANRDISITEIFHLQTDDELSDKELKQIEANDQAIQTILLGLPKDIYAAVDSCETAQEIL
nr:hypothetical protein [Tanacetum cinerariifolium]